jgi:hypothetical protein
MGDFVLAQVLQVLLHIVAFVPDFASLGMKLCSGIWSSATGSVTLMSKCMRRCTERWYCLYLPLGSVGGCLHDRCDSSQLITLSGRWASRFTFGWDWGRYSNQGRKGGAETWRDEGRYEREEGRRNGGRDGTRSKGDGPREADSHARLPPAPVQSN